MRRQAVRGLLALVLVGAVLESAGRGQPPAGGVDRVYYREKKDGPVKDTDGELKATPTGYQVISGGKVVATVSPADIFRTLPVDLPAVDRKTMLEPVNDEVAKEWEKARGKYEAIREKLKAANPPPRARRSLDFRVAYTTAKVADDTGAEGGWRDRAEVAVKLLGQFLTDHPGGWELWHAVRTQARLQGELGKYADAAQTWAKAAKAADLPADLRQEAAAQEIDALIRAGRGAEAGTRIAEAMKTAQPGPAKDKLTIYDLAAKNATTPAAGVPLIEAEIAKTKDPGVRAVGYAMLGELYLAAKKPREAMWEILRVEVVYNQDKDEVAKALARLVDVFQLQGDEDRVKNYQDKLRRHRSVL